MSNYNDPEHDDYDDDEYNYYPEENYGLNYKFDAKAWEEWIKKAIEDIIQEDENTWVVQPKFPVSDEFSKDTAKSQYFLYLGNNHYFVSDEINNLWKNHIASNAAHYLKQPNYYKGLHTILN